MANVLNRTTKQLLRSANTPDFSPVEWIISPDLRAVSGFSPDYWIITKDVITLMSQSERNVVDAQSSNKKKDEEAFRMTVSGFDRAFALAVLSEINILRVAAGLNERTMVQLKNAVRSRL